MGYWKDTEIYEEACQALARMVSDGAPIREGDSVIDFGYGCGDQILYWLQHYNPKTITGVTNEPIQATVANARIQRAGLSNAANLFIGDAVNLASWKPINNEHVIPQNGTFDVVLSLDSCYHYRPRTKFLSIASTLLKPQGRLSITDIILGPGATSSPTLLTQILFKAGLLAVGVPLENMVEEQTYRNHIEDAGFKDVEIQDITDDVFPGLVAFIERHRRAVGAVVDVERKWRQYMVVRSALRAVCRKRLLRFVVVTATKGE
ncbi:hypothetical protein HDV00_008187 [Rhizophlyctis rosea]|nr:hypothetical protein HDV00_008187 [Rhizophlyctis rosea]